MILRAVFYSPLAVTQIAISTLDIGSKVAQHCAPAAAKIPY